jgi:hypothetical protein
MMQGTSHQAPRVYEISISCIALDYIFITTHVYKAVHVWLFYFTMTLLPSIEYVRLNIM